MVGAGLHSEPSQQPSGIRLHEYQHTNHGDGCRNASPHGKIKRSKEEKMLIFSSGFLIMRDSHRVVQVPLAEVHAFPLRGDGDGEMARSALCKANPSGQKAVLTLLLGFYLRLRPVHCLWVVQRKRLRVLMPHDFEHCKENPASGIYCHYHLTLHMSPPNPKTLGNHFWSERVYHHFHFCVNCRFSSIS